ncbi:MAG: hydroxyacylglutathione hydrolase [bacterium]|nr:hydroxyacylglutathione hydrolase [Deltaproteobacteria bacterium]MCP4907584.1 hydroxyacylglutathione hydrolase [bacterium]
MGLQIERIPTFGDNYTYLVICNETQEAAIVDAPEVDPVVTRVEATGADIKLILSTHHHPDHTMANPQLAERYDAPVYGHTTDAGRSPAQTLGIDEGDEIRIGNQRGRVLFIPSHTSGHVAYVFDEAKAVFTGDMLFAGGCGRIFEGDAQMMYEALCVKLAALPNDYLVYCGHEYTEGNLRFALTIEPENPDLKERYDRVREIRANPAADWHDATPAEMTIPSSIADEKATNPFMRSGSAQELGRIRTLKDSF